MLQVSWACLSISELYIHRLVSILFSKSRGPIIFSACQTCTHTHAHTQMLLMKERKGRGKKGNIKTFGSYWDLRHFSHTVLWTSIVGDEHTISFNNLVPWKRGEFVHSKWNLRSIWKIHADFENCSTLWPYLFTISHIFNKSKVKKIVAILLSGRSPSEKAAHCMIPVTKHSSR